MVNLTRAEVQALGRRAQQPVRAAGELVAVFIPGKLVNPLNASAWGWQKRSRTAKAWRRRTELALFESGFRNFALALKTFNAQARRPKRVTFHAYTWNSMDGDGLQAALKPVRDALVECGVISGDADKDGHQFVYEQVIDRAHRGVTVRVSLLGGVGA